MNEVIHKVMARDRLKYNLPPSHQTGSMIDSWYVKYGLHKIAWVPHMYVYENIGTKVYIEMNESYMTLKLTIMCDSG
jgi:hypothetical protein